MSALTKILIVLVSLLSIFLCAVASTYVGTSINYKERAGDLASEVGRLESEMAALQSLFDSTKMSMQTNQEKLQGNYERLVRDNSDLNVKLATEERKVLESERNLDKLLAELTTFSKTIQNMNLSLEDTRVALAEARSDGVGDRKKLAELTEKLLEQFVQIQNMQVQTKRLMEEKTVLEDNFAKAKVSVPKVTPVTPQIGEALPADTLPVAPSTKGLKGYIIEVKGSLATVSIGAADGINKKDVLHVFRGSEFICDISITDVDTNKAAGVLEFVQQGGPRMGDTVTSEL